MVGSYKLPLLGVLPKRTETSMPQRVSGRCCVSVCVFLRPHEKKELYPHTKNRLCAHGSLQHPPACSAGLAFQPTTQHAQTRYSARTRFELELLEGEAAAVAA